MRGPDHRVAEVLEDPDDRVAYHRRAQMADVQFLGHVRAGVVHYDLQRRIGHRDTEAGVAKLVGCLSGDPFVAQSDVDEPRPAHLGRPGHAGQVEVARELGGHLARRPAQPLGQRKGHVGLEVGELGRPDERVRVGVLGAERRAERILHPLRENVPGIGHAVKTIDWLSGGPPDIWRGRRMPTASRGRTAPKRQVRRRK